MAEGRRRQLHSQTPAWLWGFIEVCDQGQTVCITLVYSLVPDDEDFKLH